ncbi:MAG: DJ-1/PfpI family protein [Victivallales bacterium]|nr:DJ-1/PfpI family protein [Victivallales bacterium]MCF7888695.1 DJ-1/PfpI family protein [Victivallales bacterium]
MGSIIIVFAEGFEEIEAVTPVDFLRRAGFNVLTAGLNSKTVIGSHNIPISTDILLSDIEETPTALILPGGMPGSLNLKKSFSLKKIILKTYNSGNLVASICAAAVALNSAGILKNKTVTAYPSVKDELSESLYSGKKVEIDGNIITAKAPGASFEFAKCIAEYLGKKNKAEELAKDMFF